MRWRAISLSKNPGKLRASYHGPQSAPFQALIAVTYAPFRVPFLPALQSLPPTPYNIGNPLLRLDTQEVPVWGFLRRLVIFLNIRENHGPPIAVFGAPLIEP